MKNQNLFKNVYSQCKIPVRHKKFRPADSTCTEWTDTYNALKCGVMEGAIYGLWGKRGSGKTQMASCLAGYVSMEKGKMSLYVKAFEIFLAVREAGAKKLSESEVINEYVRPLLLVIDAYEVRGDTPFEDRTLNHIIDCRYDGLRSTVIISNDSEDEFKDKLGLSILDRAAEAGGIICCNWESFRGK